MSVLTMTMLPQENAEELSPASQEPDLSAADKAALRRAVRSLEHPSYAARLANLAGKPIEFVRSALPAGAADAIASAVTQGIELALKTALRTLQHGPRGGSQFLHKVAAVAA